MAWTQSDIDALKDAIKQGVRSVSYSDRTVTYQSANEMLSILTAMEAEASSGSGSSSGRSTVASPRRS